MKKLKMTQTDGKIYHVLGLEKSILSNDYIIQCNIEILCDSYQIANGILTRTTTTKLIYKETQKTLNSQSNFKKNGAGGTRLPEFRLYYKATGSAVVKNPSANAGEARDVGSISGLGRSPGVGNGNPLQYSCLENSMDRGDWRATDHD